jgi:hypothetical protein
LDQIDWQSVLDVTESNEILSLEQGMDNLELEISRNRKRVNTIVELLIDTPSESLKEGLLETEQKLKAQTTQKAELEKALNKAKVRHCSLVSTDVVYYQLAGLEDFESRARLREENSPQSRSHWRYFWGGDYRYRRFRGEWRPTRYWCACDSLMASNACFCFKRRTLFYFG